MLFLSVSIFLSLQISWSLKAHIESCASSKQGHLLQPYSLGGTSLNSYSRCGPHQWFALITHLWWNKAEEQINTSIETGFSKIALNNYHRVGKIHRKCFIDRVSLFPLGISNTYISNLLVISLKKFKNIFQLIFLLISTIKQHLLLC